MECLNCGKDVPIAKGKPRKFCDNNNRCKMAYRRKVTKVTEKSNISEKSNTAQKILEKSNKTRKWIKHGDPNDMGTLRYDKSNRIPPGQDLAGQYLASANQNLAQASALLRKRREKK